MGRTRLYELPDSHQRMVDLFDTVVEREWALMGLFKYHNNPDKRLFANRMYLHIEHQSKNPYSSTNHTAYVPSYAEVFCSPERMKARSWVLGHEIGHSNQTRPGLKWTGTTEVTNNIMSMDVSIYLSGESKLNSVQTSTGKPTTKKQLTTSLQEITHTACGTGKPTALPKNTCTLANWFLSGN